MDLKRQHDANAYGQNQASLIVLAFTVRDSRIRDDYFN